MRYRAFLSYSHADRKYARWLHRALESYRAPHQLQFPGGSRRLSPIFRDHDELPSTADLSSAVNQALAESETLIVAAFGVAAFSVFL